MTDQRIQIEDRFRNEVSGEQFVFRATAASTAGAYVEFDNWVPAAMAGPPSHVHRRQEERFTVLSGSLRLVVDGAVQTLQAGETASVPPGTPHTFDNRQGEGVLFRVRLTPALDSERFFAGIVEAANADERALPSLPRLARLNQSLESKFELAALPGWVQRPLFGLLAKVPV